MTPVKPAVVTTGPVKEVIENQVDMTRLPILTFAAEDGGPYITGGIGIQRDPDTGRQNAGFYSLQLKGPDRVALRMLASTHGYDISSGAWPRGCPPRWRLPSACTRWTCSPRQPHADG